MDQALSFFKLLLEENEITTQIERLRDDTTNKLVKAIDYGRFRSTQAYLYGLSPDENCNWKNILDIKNDEMNLEELKIPINKLTKYPLN